MSNQELLATLRLLADGPQTTKTIGRKRTIELSRLALAMRTDEFDGPVEPHHLWRLTRTGQVYLKTVAPEWYCGLCQTKLSECPGHPIFDMLAALRRS